MKIIYIDNPHDKASTTLRSAVAKQWTADGQFQDVQEQMARGVDHITASKTLPDLSTVEVHWIDFQLAKAMGLPVSTVPSVLVEFDEVRGNFDPTNLATIAAAVKALALKKGS